MNRDNKAIEKLLASLQYPKAAKLCQEFIKKYPSNLAGNLLLAHIYDQWACWKKDKTKERLQEKAYLIYTKILKKDPNVIKALRGVGMLYHHGYKNDFKKAIFYFKKVLSLSYKTSANKNLFRIYIDLANAYRRLGKTNTALMYYQKGLNMTDTKNQKETVFFNLAFLYYEQKNTKLAKRYAETFLRLTTETNAAKIDEVLRKTMLELYEKLKAS